MLEIFERAASGRFPPADGSVVVLPQGATAAIVAFTMHHFILTNLAPDEVRGELDPTNFAAPMLAPFISWFASKLGLEAGFSDIVLATVTATAGSTTLLRQDAENWSDHSRVARALHHRSAVELWATPDGQQMAIFGSGVAGRLELSVELTADLRGEGAARGLIAEALGTRSHGTAVFAQVSPGNVASLRAFLAAGFKPICAEVIFAPPESATVPA